MLGMYFGYVLLMACNARIQTNYLPDRAYKTKRQMLSESKEKKYTRGGGT